jgi:hypothetical protein
MSFNIPRDIQQQFILRDLGMPCLTAFRNLSTEVDNGTLRQFANRSSQTLTFPFHQTKILDVIPQPKDWQYNIFP